MCLVSLKCYKCLLRKQKLWHCSNEMRFRGLVIMKNTDLFTYSPPQTNTFPYPVSNSYILFQSTVSALYSFPALFIIVDLVGATRSSSLVLLVLPCIGCQHLFLQGSHLERFLGHLFWVQMYIRLVFVTKWRQASVPCLIPAHRV